MIMAFLIFDSYSVYNNFRFQSHLMTIIMLAVLIRNIAHSWERGINRMSNVKFFSTQNVLFPFMFEKYS